MTDIGTKIDRIKKTLKYRVEPDRVPIHDFFWEEFLDRWRKEMSLPSDTNIYEYYDMDMMVLAPIWDPIIRTFKTIERTDEHIIYEDGFGAIIKKLTNISTHQYRDFRYKNLDDLEKFTYNDPLEDSRYLKSPNLISHGKVTETPSFLDSVAAYKDKFCLFGSILEGHEAIWRIHGTKETFMDLALYPERMKKQVARIGDFMLEIAIRQLETEGIEGMVIWGDVAYRNGMMFSPSAWKEIFYPVLKKMCDKIKEYDVPIIYHGCGNTTAIFNDLIEAGIDAYHTLEVKAGMDVIKLKKKYGQRCAYLGNIDAENILSSSKEVIKKDLLHKLNAAKGGGYMPGSDHSVPGNVSVENYDYFISLIRKYGKYPLNLEEYDVDKN